MTKKQLGKAYQQVVGYDIVVESKQLSKAEIIRVMKEYDQASGGDSFKKLKCYK